MADRLAAAAARRLMAVHCMNAASSNTTKSDDRKRARGNQDHPVRVLNAPQLSARSLAKVFSIARKRCSITSELLAAAVSASCRFFSMANRGVMVQLFLICR